MEPSYDPARLAQVEAALLVTRYFGSDKMGVYDIAEDQNPIPVSKRINLLFADVMIGELGPFEFVVDTGASQTVFTQKLINQLDLKPIATTFIHGFGGTGQVESGIYDIDQLSFGDIIVRNAPVGRIADPMLSKIADGIFSTTTFSEHVVTIDYPHSRIEIDAEDGSNFERIPAWVFSNLLLLPLTVNGNQPGLFLVDTGSVMTVVSHSFAAALGVTKDTPGARINLGLVGIGGFEGTILRVDDVTFTTEKNREDYPYVVSIDMRGISKIVGTEIAGVIGHDFLENYRLTIDFRKAEVRLEK